MLYLLKYLYYKYVLQGHSLHCYSNIFLASAFYSDIVKKKKFFFNIIYKKQDLLFVLCLLCIVLHCSACATTFYSETVWTREFWLNALFQKNLRTEKTERIFCIFSFLIELLLSEKKNPKKPKKSFKKSLFFTQRSHCRRYVPNLKIFT